MDCQTATAERSTRVGRPVGGYCLTSVMQVCMVWWAYKRRLIRWVDLRTWFACWELVARRCTVKAGEPKRYAVSEFEKLVGGRGGESVRRASLRRLERAGLLSWSESAIEFAASPDRMPVDDLADFWSMFENMPNRNRRVPVPRRTVRELAAGFAPVVAATVLGHLLRCLYSSRHNGWRYDGTCKASWVAEVFEVDERGVRRARRHLEGIGWLTLEESEHWHRQRYGGRAVINWAWSRPSEPASKSQTGLPGRNEQIRTGLPGPESDYELSSRYKNQKPATRGPAGFCSEEGKKKKPSMTNIELADLNETSRTLELFENAVGRGSVDASEHSRLMFVAAAERAVLRGTRNPCGLFRRLVEQKLWHHITQGDEDAAYKRLKRHFYGDLRKREPVARPKNPPRIELSEDARFAVAVTRALKQQGYRGETFHAVMREFPEWTRDRWGRAVVELENARLARLRVLDRS